ncbi:hypothetical protein [Sanguibacter sp. Z1732]|uniref:hypothetical protein n=1 Tax=Sanguibacter sp. Z1732 TaxID=3435412 RepID=UPI003D9C9686
MITAPAQVPAARACNGEYVSTVTTATAIETAIRSTAAIPMVSTEACGRSVSRSHPVRRLTRSKRSRTAE